MGTDVDTLRRWEDAGGTWVVLGRRGDGVVELSLRRCDGGEEAQRLVSGEAELLAYVGDRAAHDD